MNWLIGAETEKPGDEQRDKERLKRRRYRHNLAIRSRDPPQNDG